eukprot:TRINITY_DN7983_c0_g1_i3.p1 TRINITY_DN7983_c0_g1~~TRINITY_DN7983_c0_g1_i3.p1  ORF type:complete len:1052 (+),score=227.03 TRINITY_DN7983_c0_g1_i3:212-3157(+)
MGSALVERRREQLEKYLVQVHTTIPGSPHLARFLANAPLDEAWAAGTVTPEAAAAPGGSRPSESLRNQSGAEPELIRVLKAGDIVRVQDLLIAGENIEVVDANLNSPLHLACAGGHHFAVQALLLRHARIDARDHKRRTPLHVAAMSGKLECVKLLVDKAQVDTRDDNLQTPLHLAALNGHTAAIPLLVASGAKVDAVDHRQQTPLHLAALVGHADVIRELLKHGAQAGKEDSQGRSPLKCAIYGKHLGCARILASADKGGSSAKPQSTGVASAAAPEESEGAAPPSTKLRGTGLQIGAKRPTASRGLVRVHLSHLDTHTAAPLQLSTTVGDLIAFVRKKMPQTQEVELEATITPRSGSGKMVLAADTCPLGAMQMNWPPHIVEVGGDEKFKFVLSPKPEGADDVPQIVKACISRIEALGLGEPGLFRVSGSSTEVKRFMELYNRLSFLDLSGVSDIHTCTGILKHHLRLREPLLTFKMFPEWSAATSAAVSLPEQLQLFRAALQKLPRKNQLTLAAILELLDKVAALASVNKMNMANLATVFGPTLLRSEADEDQYTMVGSNCVLILLENAPHFCEFLRSGTQQQPASELVKPSTLQSSSPISSAAPSAAVSQLGSPAAAAAPKPKPSYQSPPPRMSAALAALIAADSPGGDMPQTAKPAGDELGNLVTELTESRGLSRASTAPVLPSMSKPAPKPSYPPGPPSLVDRDQHFYRTALVCKWKDGPGPLAEYFEVEMDTDGGSGNKFKLVGTTSDRYFVQPLTYPPNATVRVALRLRALNAAGKSSFSRAILLIHPAGSKFSEQPLPGNAVLPGSIAGEPASAVSTRDIAPLQMQVVPASSSAPESAAPLSVAPVEETVKVPVADIEGLGSSAEAELLRTLETITIAQQAVTVEPSVNPESLETPDSTRLSEPVTEATPGQSVDEMLSSLDSMMQDLNLPVVATQASARKPSIRRKPSMRNADASVDDLLGELAELTKGTK